MKKTLTLLTTLFALSIYTQAQTSIDSSFNFQTDPNKKVSIYIPSSYNSATPNGMVVGFHPFNVNRWDAQSWRDTLISFAESNQVILLCPDGGTDGMVDDIIDQAFTTAMMDSMMIWYNIDTNRVVAAGFSWGGKTTYIYGLHNYRKFCGFIPIGAAINIREIAGIRDSIKDKPIYIVHGSNDFPNDRYTPFVSAMQSSGGIVNSLLMQGVGHTIDFPNRNAILSTAFQWVDSVCNFTPTPNSLGNNKGAEAIQIFPNPVQVGAQFTLGFEQNTVDVKVMTLDGKLLYQDTLNQTNSMLQAPEQSGAYVLLLKFDDGQEFIKKIMVVD